MKDKAFTGYFILILLLLCVVVTPFSSCHKIETFVAQMPEVLILGVVGFAVDLQRNVVRFRVFDLFLTGFDIPFAPGSDDGHIGKGKISPCRACWKLPL